MQNDKEVKTFTAIHLEVTDLENSINFLKMMGFKQFNMQSRLDRTSVYMIVNDQPSFSICLEHYKDDSMKSEGSWIEVSSYEYNRLEEDLGHNEVLEKNLAKGCYLPIRQNDKKGMVKHIVASIDDLSNVEFYLEHYAEIKIE